MVKNTDRKDLFRTANYSTIKTRREKKGGGVGIYVKCSAKAKYLGKLEKNSVEAISILINHRE